MNVIHVTATSGADGRLLLDIPTGTAGDAFDVAVELHSVQDDGAMKPTPVEDANANSQSKLAGLYGCISDEQFVAPPRTPSPELMRTCGAIDDETFDVCRPTDLPPAVVLG
jgi:hypothetical protein